MGYNNPYMTPYMQSIQQRQTPIQQQPQSQYMPPFNDVRYVNEKEVKDFIALAGQRFLLIDSTAKKMWIKSADGMGVQSLETYKFEKIDNSDPEVASQSIDTSLFVQRDDLKNVATKDEIENLKQVIEELRKQVRISQIVAKDTINTKGA